MVKQHATMCNKCFMMFYKMLYSFGQGFISIFAVGYSMLGKKILKMAPPSIQKFDLEDTGKLVVMVAASGMTREYLIKQKILPEHNNSP